jgi:hypothetical protein
MERLAGEFDVVSGTSKETTIARLTQTLQQAGDVGSYQAERSPESA